MNRRFNPLPLAVLVGALLGGAGLAQAEDNDRNRRDGERGRNHDNDRGHGQADNNRGDHRGDSDRGDQSWRDARKRQHEQAERDRRDRDRLEAQRLERQRRENDRLRDQNARLARERAEAERRAQAERERNRHRGPAIVVSPHGIDIRVTPGHRDHDNQYWRQRGRHRHSQWSEQMRLREMIQLGNYAEVDQRINARNLEVDSWRFTTDGVYVIQFQRDMNAWQVSQYMARNGLVAATVEQLLAYGAQNPNNRFRRPLVALGTNWDDRGGNAYVFIGRSDSGQRKLDVSYDQTFEPFTQFLVYKPIR